MRRTVLRHLWRTLFSLSSSLSCLHHKSVRFLSKRSRAQLCSQLEFHPTALQQVSFPLLSSQLLYLLPLLPPRCQWSCLSSGRR